MLNNRLYKAKIVQQPECTFCDAHVENMKHFFWDCEITKVFWYKVQEVIQAIIPCQLTLDWIHVFLNALHDDNTHVANLIVLVAKQHLYKWRCFKKDQISMNLNVRLVLYKRLRKIK